MHDRPFWSSIWPEKLKPDKRSALSSMGFEYDYNCDAFVHRQLRKVISFDAASDMKLDELNHFGSRRSLSAAGDFRFRGEIAQAQLELLQRRYGWP